MALTIQAGNSPSGVAVNPNTGRVYVANRGDGTISVIDSATKTVIGTITVGDIPADLAVNPATNRLYLTYSDNNITTVIDGSTGQVVGNIAVPQNVKAIAVNSLTNTIYFDTPPTTPARADATCYETLSRNDSTQSKRGQRRLTTSSQRAASLGFSRCE